MLGMVFCWMDRLKISVRALTATGPRSFRCLYEIPSGQTAEVGFVCSIDCLVILGVKGGGGRFVGAACFGLCLVSCQWGRV